jgi:hypothetical protein
MRTLWMALILSIGGYFVLTLFAHRSDSVDVLSAVRWSQESIVVILRFSA